MTLCHAAHVVAVVLRRRRRRRRRRRPWSSLRQSSFRPSSFRPVSSFRPSVVCRPSSVRPSSVAASPRHYVTASLRRYVVRCPISPSAPPFSFAVRVQGSPTLVLTPMRAAVGDLRSKLH